MDTRDGLGRLAGQHQVQPPFLEQQLAPRRGQFRRGQQGAARFLENGAQQLQGQIDGPKNLPGKTVGVVEGDPGQDYVKQHGLQHIVYSDMAAAAEASSTDLMRR